MWWHLTQRSTRDHVLQPLVADHRPVRPDDRNYAYTLRLLAKHLGGEDRLAHATRDELERFLADRMGEVSSATVSTHFRALRG